MADYCVNWAAANIGGGKMSTQGYIDFSVILAGRTIQPGPVSVGAITAYRIFGEATDRTCNIEMDFTSTRATWDTSLLNAPADTALYTLIYNLEVIFSDNSGYYITPGQSTGTVTPGGTTSSFNNCTPSTPTPTPTKTPTPTPTTSVSSFVLSSAINCQTACNLPINNLVWNTTVDNPCNATPWTISNNNLSIRYDVVDSEDCGGTCASEQAGTATATITVGNVNTYLGLEFIGIGERELPNYELIKFYLNGTEVANGHAPGGSLGCAMGPIVETVLVPGPYLLLANTSYTFLIDFTTNDELYHVDAYYEVNLSLSASTQSTYFSNCVSLTTGCYLYTNNGLTTPVSNGSYSNYTDCYTVVGGVITNIGPCIATTSTPTPTKTPTNTPTPTKTPTNTPTQTKTPSSPPIICGLGLTTGTYYYTNCCNIFTQGSQVGLEVSFDYTKPFGGVTKLDTRTTVVCSTPTPTPTPTVTPTNTATPTQTPTNTSTPVPTNTPSNTPSNSPVTRLKNECDVITLFDMGISCNVIQSPTESNPLGGILSINVTGGTAPYSFIWNRVPGAQTLSGIRAGSYEVVVTDYKWPDGKPDGISDYTATTICELVGPLPSLTPTTTPTPTPTSPVQCVDLCLIAIAPIGVTNLGPLQFVCNGTQNGRFKWTGGGYDIIWNVDKSRWEIYITETTTPLTLGGGIVVSTTFDLIPDSAWTTLGGTVQYSITMTKGDCPISIPLQIVDEKTNSSCQGTTNCNGQITLLTEGGFPPYSYSINGGTTYTTDNNFTNLCPNTYEILVSDSSNNSQIKTVTIDYDSIPVIYQLSLANVGNATPTTVPNVSQTVTQEMTLNVIPSLPVGVSVTFNLTTENEIIINGPGTGTSSLSWNIAKNNVPLTTIVGPASSSENTRPNCSPNTQTTTTTKYENSITINSEDIITITATTVDTIINGQVGTQTNCTTNINSVVRTSILTPVINGNTCSSVISSGSRIVSENVLTYVPGTITTSCPDCVNEDISIGTQVWKKCNLDVTTYSDGTEIPEVTDQTQWNGLTTGAWCYYDNDSLNGTTYGKLYNWYAVNDPRGLAPDGYHIPTDEEWTILTNYLGGESVAGGKMKEEGFCHWVSPNVGATNQSLFTALPGGQRDFSGALFLGIGEVGDWWSSSSYNSSLAWERLVNYLFIPILRRTNSKTRGFSVRLIKDTSVTYNNYLPTGSINRGFTGVAIAPNNDAYTTSTYSTGEGDICEKLSSNTTFNRLSLTSRQYNDIAATPSGDIYAVVYFGGIYKQTNGTGSFVSIGQDTNYWTGICSATNNDMYACEGNTGRIFKKLASETNFTILHATTGLTLRDITIDSSGNIYICTSNDIYKQTGGVGSFNPLGTTGQKWTGLAAAPNGDIFACSEDTSFTDGGIFVQYGATGSFVSLNQANRDWSGIAVSNGVSYATVNVGDVYKMTF